MNENNDWNAALENEINQAEAMEQRLKETNLDTDTRDIIKQRLLSSLQLDMINNY